MHLQPGLKLWLKCFAPYQLNQRPKTTKKRHQLQKETPPRSYWGTCQNVAGAPFEGGEVVCVCVCVLSAKGEQMGRQNDFF